jgi:hypothetical protein
MNSKGTGLVHLDQVLGDLRRKGWKGCGNVRGLVCKCPSLVARLATVCRRIVDKKSLAIAEVRIKQATKSAIHLVKYNWMLKLPYIFGLSHATIVQAYKPQIVKQLKKNETISVTTVGRLAQSVKSYLTNVKWFCRKADNLEMECRCDWLTRVLGVDRAPCGHVVSRLQDTHVSKNWPKNVSVDSIMVPDKEWLLEAVKVAFVRLQKEMKVTLEHKRWRRFWWQ